MDSYEWIMYAGMAVWSGFGLYLGILVRKQAALSRRINRMERLMEEE